MLIPFFRCVFFAAGLCGLVLLTGCNTAEQRSAAAIEPSATASTHGEMQRINDLQRQMAERQRQCNEEKRRQEQSLKESHKRNEELQKKLDTLLAIDRELRSRGKGS